MIIGCALLIVVFSLAFRLYFKNTKACRGSTAAKSPRIVPLSVNYHFTRKCNYECGFCFHTAKTSNIAGLEDAKMALWLLKQEGMKKLNFAGGEPFLYARYLGHLVRFCKEDLKLESVSIVSNGSKIREDWICKYGIYVDILAISCDSFNEETNKLIGRHDFSKKVHNSHLDKVVKVAEWCRNHNIKLKINTVVNRYNFQEDMNENIQRIAPFRWKCFQVLVVQGENDSDETLRNASRFLITDDEFRSFCVAHERNSFFVPESNNLMKNSYLILDENLCFLNHSGNFTINTRSILDIGVEKALREAGWDQESFVARGGIYDWTNKKEQDGCSTAAIDW